MEKFEESILKSVADGTALGVPLQWTNLSFGASSLESDAPPMKSDSLVWIASMTKLLTAIACLQCVERGQLSLDEPVSDILPEYASPQIFTGVDETTNEPIYKPAPRAPALREILTHTSGMGYTTMHPLLQQWCTAVGKAPDITFRSVKESHSNPLVFAPGTGWAYGSGIDWAGKLVERVYNNQRLGAYMKQHILDPLGMTSSTFHPLNEGDGALKERLVQRPMRDPGSGKLIGDLSGLHPLLDDREDDFGGSGLYSCAEDYVEVVKSLLLNDGRLLGRETVEMLFTPGLSKVTRDAQWQALDSPFAAALIPGLPKVGERRGAGGQAVEYEFALGGNVIVNEGGVGGFADKGCLYWSGVANSQWFIDRARGVCGVYMTEVMPPGDGPTQDLYRLWREGVYQLAGEA